MCRLVIGTPSSDGITNVAAAELDLSIVTHGGFGRRIGFPERVGAKGKKVGKIWRSRKCRKSARAGDFFSAGEKRFVSVKVVE